MTPTIYALADDETYKALYVTDCDLQFSHEAFKTPQAFTDARVGANPTEQIVVPFNDIEKIVYIEDDYDVTVDFKHDPNKQGGETVEFENNEQAGEFVRTLTAHLDMDRREEEEDLYSALYATAPWFLGALAIFIVTLFIEEEDMMGRRGRKGAAIARLIYGVLGQTGVIVLAGLITVGLGYLMIARLTNRKKVFTYTR